LTRTNASSYANSQHLFIAVGAGGVALALLLGLVLSWSIIGPIRRMDTHLATISAGDFSRHVEVSNRDELGALAANLNRMNDELGRLYKELESVSRHKSEFLANMSHELRTPLNAIIGFSEVLGQKMFGDLNDRQAEYVEDIRSAGQHLLLLINEILDLSKVEAGKMEIDVSPVSIAEVLSSGVTMQRERASSHGITLSLEVPDDLSVINADERLVRQVVFNLLSNAVKFTPDGGFVSVSARTVDSMVEISVADTGIGIAPEDLGLIFEEFRQGSAAARIKPEGTGLGLALSRKFVELHGGRLWVDSQLGEGSTFHFTLPMSMSPMGAGA
jgi:signal transduction histidine kinase